MEDYPRDQMACVAPVASTGVGASKAPVAGSERSCTSQTRRTVPGVTVHFGSGLLEVDVAQVGRSNGQAWGAAQQDARGVWRSTKYISEDLRKAETDRSAIIAVAAGEDGKGIGRIRLQHIPDASEYRHNSFVEEHLEPGSPHRRNSEGYTGLEDTLYRHVSGLRGNRREPHQPMPRVHRVASNK